MMCPHCQKPLTPEEIRSLWGSYCGSLQTPHAGPGRPGLAARKKAELDKIAAQMRRRYKAKPKKTQTNPKKPK